MAELEPAELFSYGIPLESAFLDAKEIRDALTALAQTFLTTDDTKPLDARDGQIRVNAADPTNTKLDVFINGAWRRMLQNIENGTAAPVKQVVQIITPTTPWIIDHNLGSQVVAQVFDLSFVKLQPVNAFALRNIPIARLDTSLAVGPVVTGFPLEFDGDILSVFAVVEGAPLAGAALLVDFIIDKTPGGGGPTPIGGGTITLTTGATGAVIPGAPVTAPNSFASSGAPLTPDVLDIVTSGSPGTGVVNLWLRTQRTINPGEYRLTQVTENRITVDHPEPTAGFVVLTG